MVLKRLAVLGILMTGALAVSAGNAQAAVWKAENTWSKEWEDRYAHWVETNWDENFFARPGTPYTGLHLDCADTVYSMRIIFSRENKLPFAMNDPSGGKKLITNEMTRFDHLPEESRIRQFLSFVYGIGSTSSLPADTYPAAISRETVRSGSLILTNKESHHSWTIKKVLPTGIPHLIYSSRPAKNVLLVRIGQPSVEFTFKNKIEAATHAGFRNFRRIEDLTKPVWEAQGYSDDQYKVPAKNWMMTAKKKLSLVDESPETLLRRTLETACQGSRERIGSINEGVEFLKKSGARCMNAEEFDNYSTPNRDTRLRNAFEELQDAYVAAHGNAEAWSKLPADLAAQVQDVFNDESSANANERTCPVEIAPGKVLSLSQIRQRSLNKILSSNPHDNLEARWGETTTMSILARKCPVYE